MEKTDAMERAEKTADTVPPENYTGEPARVNARVKSAVFVGASSGIGYETALRLLGKGYTVSNISRTPCTLGRVRNYKADVSAGSSLEKAVCEAVSAVGGELDALIYCAGFSMAAPLEYAEEKDYRYLFDVNFFGAVRAIQSAVPYMKGKGGRIVLVSSMGSLFPVAFDSFYSSSKAAVDMLVKSAALELEPYNIRVCSVQPGGTSTAFTFKRKIYGDAKNKDYAEKVKLAASALADMEQGGMSAGEVARSVAEAVCGKNPPLLLQCGGWNKFCAMAKRVLPDKAAQYLNKRIYKQ